MSKKKINYSLRPAKNIERKMICEILRRLADFRLIETYRYIGFGSYYFTDFILFHKALNLKSMCSIEKDLEHEKRYRANKPFNCIDLKFGHSNQVLRQIDWNEPTIIWLDYDGTLTKSVLSDIQAVCSSAISGSILIVTVNAQLSTSGNQLVELSETLGEENIPLGTSPKDMAGWGTAKVMKNIINNNIEETLIARNGTLRKGYKFIYEQLMNFHYSDGARMLTTGGILYEDGQKPIVGKCAFDSLAFVRKGEDSYEIKIPYLTFREIRDLNCQLPEENLANLKVSEMFYPELTEDLQKAIETYARVYRYFPNFAEAEF